jgi:hypothetical protein
MKNYIVNTQNISVLVIDWEEHRIVMKDGTTTVVANKEEIIFWDGTFGWMQDNLENRITN